MAKKVRVQMNDAGVRAVLKSPGVTNLLSNLAADTAARAGGGYESEVGTAGKSRNRAWVRTATYEARKDNAENATLLRALGR